MSKQIYTWSQVEAGDIISFRYKGKNPTGTLTSPLVMNPKMPFEKKDGSRTSFKNKCFILSVIF